MKRVVWSCGVALALTLGSGCGKEPNHLEGSVESSHALDFTDVSLTLLTRQARFELRYDKALEGGGGNDVVVKLVFDQPAGGVVLNTNIDLTQADAVLDRVTVANDKLPDLRQGLVRFSQGAATDGEQTIGEFSTTLENGTTLNGGFDTALSVVDF
jgi:hypothetical protein